MKNFNGVYSPEHTWLEQPTNYTMEKYKIMAVVMYILLGAFAFGAVIGLVDAILKSNGL